MSIRVHLYSNLQQFTDNHNEVEVSGSRIGECLDDLVRQFPRIKPVLFNKRGKMSDTIFVSINLKSPHPEELTKLVNNGDELYIVRIIAGG
jgi:molybdopterin converting factor small subunit